MTEAEFEWQPMRSGTKRYWRVAGLLGARVRERIEADRAFPSPEEDHVFGAWPPAGSLAPLADLEVEPERDHVPTWLLGAGDFLFAVGPADGRPGEHVLARGTRLRPIAHGEDPYHEGFDLDFCEVLDGRDAGTTLALCCGGRWGPAKEIANLLIARADEPILGDPGAGNRLVADLRAIADHVWTNAAASDD